MTTSPPMALELDPLACALLIIVAFTGAGLAHAIWLWSPMSARFAIPVDGYATVRGRRLFGDNKTWRGLLVMVPAAGAAFFALGALRPALPVWFADGTWTFSPAAYGLLGLWAGFGFMAGELPNSFLKRQLLIAPGTAPVAGWAKPVSFALDRLDSILGMMLALSILVPMPLATWGYVLLVGPAIHFLFSALLYALGVKARSA